MTCRWIFLSFGVMVIWCLCGSRACSQPPDFDFAFNPRTPSVLRGIDLFAGPPFNEALSANHGPYSHLLRMPSVFISDPIDVTQEGDIPFEEISFLNSGRSTQEFATDWRMQMSMGTHNPLFDFRRPSDPGGVGYYKLHSQFLLLGDEHAGCTLRIQAVTPAGLEADGLATGPTILSPSVAWCYQAKDGTALQTFCGKDMRTRAHWSDRLHHSFVYGVALERPIPGLECSQDHGVRFFVEALGRFRYDSGPVLAPTAPSSPARWDILPGLHWQLHDRCWLTGGMLMPIHAAGLDRHLFQLTCSWQY
jgi:hypothetical protein